MSYVLCILVTNYFSVTLIFIKYMHGLFRTMFITSYEN